MAKIKKRLEMKKACTMRAYGKFRMPTLTGMRINAIASHSATGLPLKRRTIPLPIGAKRKAKTHIDIKMVYIYTLTNVTKISSHIQKRNQSAPCGC